MSEVTYEEMMNTVYAVGFMLFAAPLISLIPGLFMMLAGILTMSYAKIGRREGLKKTIAQTG